MLRPDGYVKVLDFGLAKLSDATRRSISGDVPASQRSFNQTMPGTIMGTAAYMSPEQAEGDEVDARTDVWGLGVLLYEMAAGKLPFDGPTASHMIVAILEHTPDPIEHVSPDLQRIITTALQKDKALRYQSAEAMSAALDELKHKLGYVSDKNLATPKPPVKAIVPARPSPYRKLLWLVPAAFLILLAFTGGMYALAVWFLNTRPPVNVNIPEVNTATPSPTRTIEPTPTAEQPLPTPVVIYVAPTPVPTATPAEVKPERTPRKQPSPEVVPTPAKPVNTPVVKKTPKPRPKPSQDPNCVFTNSCQ